MIFDYVIHFLWRQSTLRIQQTIFVCLCILFLTSSAHVSFAQEKSPQPIPVEIRKKNATVLTGKLLGMNKDSIQFRDQSNQLIQIARSDIRSIDYIDTLKKSTQWNDVPNSVRYLLAPTAIPLKKNEVLIENSYLFFTSGRIGITNSISVAMGAELLFRSMYFANIKATMFRRPNYQFAACVNYYQLNLNGSDNPFSNDNVSRFVMISGLNTWGNANRHLTVSASYLYAFGQFLPPNITVSGVTRISRKVALVSENWFFFVDRNTGIPAVVSLGIRLMGKQGSFDFGLYDDSKTPFHNPVPYLGYVYRVR